MVAENRTQKHAYQEHRRDGREVRAKPGCAKYTVASQCPKDHVQAKQHKDDVRFTEDVFQVVDHGYCSKTLEKKEETHGKEECNKNEAALVYDIQNFPRLSRNSGLIVICSNCSNGLLNYGAVLRRQTLEHL